MAGILNCGYFIREKDIEFESIKLLIAYEKKLGKKVTPPIPVDSMIEYLGYDFNFLSDGIYADERILGGINYKNKLIEINECITSHEGRMNFTIAHEIGHERLHIPLMLAERAQISLFDTLSDDLDIVCRRNAGNDKKDPIEWQADKFASYLLMPTEQVKKAFLKTYDSPINVIENSKTDFITIPVEYNTRFIAEEIMENGGFSNVSIMAMANRLIGMELLQGVPFQNNNNFHHSYV